MRRFLPRLALAGLVLAGALSLAQASPEPPWTKGNNCGGTIASGGTAQTISMGGVGQNVHGYELQNLSSDPLAFSEFTTSPAVTGTNVRLLNAGTAGSAAGGYYSTPSFYAPAGVVSIIGATTGDKFFCNWW